MEPARGHPTSLGTVLKWKQNPLIGPWLSFSNNLENPHMVDLVWCSVCRTHGVRGGSYSVGTSIVKKNNLMDHAKSKQHVDALRTRDFMCKSTSVEEDVKFSPY